MLIKILVGILLLLMIYNLFRALLVMLKNDPQQPPMSKYIGRRVLISAAIILILILAVLSGIITPNPTPH